MWDDIGDTLLGPYYQGILQCGSILGVPVFVNPHIDGEVSFEVESPKLFAISFSDDSTAGPWQPVTCQAYPKILNPKP